MKWATKSDYDLEAEEAERLVREAPKDKPPRRDRRRERMDTESDPDPDLGSGDKSLNYKDVGGSTISRKILLRLADETVKVRRRDTGKVVQVSEDTLRDSSGEYEEIKEEGKKQTPEKDEAFFQSAGSRVWELASGDKALSSRLKDLSNPSSQLSGLVKENPDFSVRVIFKGVALPEGIETLGDLSRALKAAPSKKPPKKAPKIQKKPPTGPETSSTDPKTPSTEDSSPKTEEKPKKGPDKEPDKGTDVPNKGTESPPPPKRRKASNAEYLEAAGLLADTFPLHVANRFIDSKMHPDDVQELISVYEATKSGAVSNATDFADLVSTFYETDPNNVKPPSQWDDKPFDELSSEEKSEAFRTHQLQTVALSLAAKDKLMGSMAPKGSKGQPLIPSVITESVADFMLRGRKMQATPEKRSEMARRFSDSTFETVTKQGVSMQIPDGAVQKVLGKLKDDPDAALIVKAFLSANDYNTAKERFLSSGSDEVISELDRPQDITKALIKATKFFEGRSQLYGGDPYQSKTLFRVRVLGKLKTLAPQKYTPVKNYLDKLDVKAYESDKKSWEKSHKDWEKRKNQFEKNLSIIDLNKEFPEPAPEPPIKPLSYGLVKSGEGKGFWKSQLRRVRGLKTASRVVRRFEKSSYLNTSTMDKSKSAVYHGVDPYGYGVEDYPGWQQANSARLTDADYAILAASAKRWLESPVIKDGSEGLDEKVKLRAALDLAIETSKYNGLVPSRDYELVLAKLSSESAPEIVNSVDVEREMVAKAASLISASKELSKLAAKAAAKDPELGYEILELSRKVASLGRQEHSVKSASESKWLKLRAVIIRTAAADAKVRDILKPILQIIKDLS